MSLFLPLSTDQYHTKPMAISSITSPVGVHCSTGGGVAYGNNTPSTVCPSPSSSTHSDTVSPPPTSSKYGSSSPPSHSFSNYSASTSTSSFSSSSMKHRGPSNGTALPPPTLSYYHPYHCVSSSGAGNDSDHGNSTPVSAPLSLHERKLRNKTASAKYRAKKNQQHGEMRAMISSLTKENELLLRQLDHIQHENGHLKGTCDRLRGKIMAQKMLKQYLVESEQQQQPGSIIATTAVDSNCYLHYHPTSSIEHRKFPDIDEKGDWDKRD